MTLNEMLRTILDSVNEIYAHTTALIFIARKLDEMGLPYAVDAQNAAVGVNEQCWRMMNQLSAYALQESREGYLDTATREYISRHTATEIAHDTDELNA
jgi:hypothetical protein